MFVFKKIVPEDSDWNAIENACDSTVFHCQKWSDYLKKAGYKPIVFSVEQGGNVIGFFVGVKKWMLANMICAPMQGNGTYTQGLCFEQPVSEEKRVSVYKELADWIFKNRMASLLQVDDWQLRRVYDDWISTDHWKQETLEAFGITHSVRVTLHLDMKGKSEEDLWAGLHYKSAKYSINKAAKLGLHVRVIDKVEDIPEFVRIHHEHVVNVHDRHGTRPKHAQSRGRMQKVCETLFPDRVLMLQTLGQDENGVEQVMASSIFCYDKGESVYWTSGSYAQYLKKYCPNEIMFWEALKILQQRGVQELNLGGMSSYKLKYGSTYAYVPRFYFYKYKSVYKLKVFALKAYHALRHLIKSE